MPVSRRDSGVTIGRSFATWAAFPFAAQEALHLRAREVPPPFLGYRAATSQARRIAPLMHLSLWSSFWGPLHPSALPYPCPQVSCERGPFP